MALTTRPRRDADSATGPLTEREWQVIELVIDGHTNESIGHQLEVSKQTVMRHLTNIFGKLSVSSRTEMAVLVLKDRQAEELERILRNQEVEDMKLMKILRASIAIRALLVYGAALALALAFPALAQTPQVKACQLQYSHAVEQLNTAFVALSDRQTLQRDAVRRLAMAVESDRVLILQRPEDAFLTLCNPESFGDLDAVVSLLRSGGYLPNPKDLVAFHLRIAAQETQRSVACFYLIFHPEGPSPILGAGVALSEMRSEAPGRFRGC